jgi:hypothetical protein
MSSKINLQSLEADGLEFVTRLSNSTLEALLKDLPGETQLESPTPTDSLKSSTTANAMSSR